MTDPTYLREERLGLEGLYVEVWHCRPPHIDAYYFVRRDVWDVDVAPPERHIYEIKVKECKC